MKVAVQFGQPVGEDNLTQWADMPAANTYLQPQNKNNGAAVFLTL